VARLPADVFNRRMGRIWLGLLLALFLHPAVAQEALEKVDVELILMADGSGSVDTYEFRLQRGGYARALRDPNVIEAIKNGFFGQIAISYVEWSGPSLQVPIVPWMVVKDEADIDVVARLLEQTPRQLYGGGTTPGNAILYGARSLLSNQFEGKRMVIDVSGDGPDMGGFPSSRARDQAVAQGITINGLPIINDFPRLDQFYKENIIGGRDAFSITANDFEDFFDAVRMKLIREIAGLPSFPSWPGLSGPSLDVAKQ
jgi:hypothetical protein